jgi:hypothetical protein
MGLNITRSLTAVAVAMLPLVGATATFSVMGAEAAYAERGNGNGNGGGNGGGRSSDRGSQRSDDRGNGHGRGSQGSEERGNGNGQGNGRGAIASELKGLNACHASEQARANAAPESQVGRIAAYATAAEAADSAQDAIVTANENLAAYDEAYLDVKAEIEADYADFDLSLQENAALAAELTTRLEEAEQAYSDGRTALVEAVTAANDAAEGAQTAAADAFRAASNGRELSPEARAALDECLNG